MTCRYRRMHLRAVSSRGSERLQGGKQQQQDPGRRGRGAVYTVGASGHTVTRPGQ